MTVPPQSPPARSPVAPLDATAPDPARRRLAVAGLAVLVVALVVALAVRVGPLRVPPACTVLAGERSVRPPAVVADTAARVADDLAPAADVTVTCSLDDPTPVDATAPDPADDPARWTVAVDAEARAAADVPAAARAVLAAAPADAPFTWRLDVHDARRTLAVVLTPGRGAGTADDALALHGLPGVAEVWLGPDSGRVAVATTADVAAVVAAAGRDLPPMTVEARDHWLEVQQVHAGSWVDADALALAADVAGWEGVWRVVLRGGAPAGPELTVEADDDAHRAHVASRLATVVHPGPPVGYHVVAQQVAVDGVLGTPPVPTSAAPAAAPAAGSAAAGPECTGAELRVEVVGTDAAAGRRFLVLRATHAGGAPCVVEGVPALAFTRRSGTPTPDLTQLPDLVAPDVPPATLLAPGDGVDAQVEWGAMSTSQDPDVAVAVTVRPVTGGPAVDLPLDHELDVLAGATVEVGPWRPVEVGGADAG